ncbi:MAG: hypothetical protein WCI73_09535 [Phycisphaerae bacterium]
MQTVETGELQKDDKGFAHLDGAKLFDEAIRLAGLPSVRWFMEDECIEPHPIQKAPEPDERSPN